MLRTSLFYGYQLSECFHAKALNTEINLAAREVQPTAARSRAGKSEPDSRLA